MVRPRKDRLDAQCNFCDTDFLGTNGENGGKFETASKLARHANKFWPDETTKKFIVLTGGEPMLSRLFLIPNCIA